MLLVNVFNHVCLELTMQTNALKVNKAPWLLGSLVADITLAGLVKEGVSGMHCMARDLIPCAVLALDVVATQMAPLHTRFAALDPGHLGDLGQSSSLGSSSMAHPGGRSAAGSRDSRLFSHSAHTACQTCNAFLSYHRQVAVGDHGQVAR